jgi:hypothetical protein
MPQLLQPSRDDLQDPTVSEAVPEVGEDRLDRAGHLLALLLGNPHTALVHPGV